MCGTWHKHMFSCSRFHHWRTNGWLPVSMGKEQSPVPPFAIFDTSVSCFFYFFYFLNANVSLSHRVKDKCTIQKFIENTKYKLHSKKSRRYIFSSSIYSASFLFLSSASSLAASKPSIKLIPLPCLVEYFSS